MKKSVKRILCSVLSVALCSTFVVESALRLNADSAKHSSAATAEASFTNVTGKYDTSKLREENFNDKVLQAEDTAPRYETRTVMVTLSGDSITKRANGADVPTYMDSWSGEMAKLEIENEQTAFLSALSKKGIPYQLDRTYNTVLNGVAVKLNTKYVSEIKKMRGVDSVVITTKYNEPTAAEYSLSGVVENKTNVYATGIYNSSDFTAEGYGKGMVVAVLDTGLDYTHEAFQSFQTPENDWTEAEKNSRWSRSTVKSKIEDNDLVAEDRSGSLDVADVYMNAKVPFAYDYADDDADVYPSYSNHGTHVAGIIGGYNYEGYTDKDGNPVKTPFVGVVPDAQLMICKVFTDDLDDPDLGGAVSEDIVAALDDCVKMGVDVINMSLGSSAGFSTTNDGDEEGNMLNAVYEAVRKSGISLICAASNDYSAGYGGVYGTNLASNPDAGTVGSPSTFAGALSVASINGQKADYFLANPGENQSYVFFEEARDINSNAMDFVKELQEQNSGKKSFEYVVVPGTGAATDFTTVSHLFRSGGQSLGRVALVKRGDFTFEEKVRVAKDVGAIGVIIYNNVAGTIRMNLGEIKNPVPSVSVSMNAGAAMVAGATNNVGTISIDESYAAGPFMSEFSSWGPTPDLKLKPEITAHGGEITSAVPGGYGEQSGTSMASPNMAGFAAIVRSYIERDLSSVLNKLKTEYPDTSEAVLINRLAMQLTMSTAATVYDQDGLPYSPRKQGAGVAKLENIVSVEGKSVGTKAYLWTDSDANDYRPKLELGDELDKKDEIVLSFKVTNFDGATALTFQPTFDLMTETLSSDRLTVSEQAHILADSTGVWKVNGNVVEGDVVVPAGEECSLTLTLTLGEDDRKYIEESFENGMYVEGFAKLLSKTNGQCDLSLPFLGFYGDWEQAPMLDYSAYEVAANAQDSAVLEEDKIKASVWETQPYNIYYNDKYILPMGGYLYLLPEDAEEMYVNEEYNAVSRYNEYYGEGEPKNYMTSTGLKAVYAGLLRNARVVKYRLYDESTGEILMSDTLNRISKAYSGGGSAVPANVELEIYPEENGFIANGRYRMEFEFFQEKPEEGVSAREEDTFAFSFTVDYDAPMMEAARVRFENYKEGNKEKQRIYLDVDVYDNHYAQTLMLCYPKTNDDGDVSLQLLTEYPTPIRNPKKNAVTTVSIEITDIYEEYGDQLYVQLDDYALNSCLYQVNINKANADMLPDTFTVAEKNVTLDIYGTHKSTVLFGEDYSGFGDRSNLVWTSVNPKIADVKNGEIVGLSAGKTKIYASNGKGGMAVVNVTVTDTVGNLPKVPAVSFGVIKTDTESLQKADGIISVNAGKTFKLNVKKDPWYHPMTDLKIEWTTSNPEVATVDNEGNVRTLEEGLATISATVYQKDSAGKWEETLYSAVSMMQVQEEFKVSNYTLTAYNGVGYNEENGILRIPTDLNIMMIGSEAFKENNTIKKIIIPESVTEIQERAFINCTALEEVYFVDVAHDPNGIAKSDLTMVYEQAFYGCKNLRVVDLTNVKTITVAADCFGECPNLSNVIDMQSIGTMHHRAFAGTALTSVDLRGLHMSGKNVFASCTKIKEIITGKFTAIGEGMFEGCLSLTEKLTLHTPKIGKNAFKDCANLPGVLFDGAGEEVEFDVGASAFESCGTGVESFTVEIAQGTKIRSIGARAFANTPLTTVGKIAGAVSPINGLEVLGEDAFFGTKISTVYVDDTFNLATVRLTGIPFDRKLTVKVAAGSAIYYEDSATGILYDSETPTRVVYANASFAGDSEGTFVLPATVTHINDYAFANSNIQKLVLPASLTDIGVGAFKNAKIRAVEFAADSVIKEIPARAFEGSMLKTITLPDSVVRIGEYAFANSALSVFKGGFAVNSDDVKSIASYAFADCPALSDVTLADGIERMGDYVFTGCASLKEITLPSLQITEDIPVALGSYTFWGASALEKVTYGANATDTGTYTFAQTPVTSVTFGRDIKLIGEGLFFDCVQLKDITLPEGIEEIGPAAFSGCIRLGSVEDLAEGEERKITSELAKVKVFGTQSFYNTGLTKLTLTNATHIGSMAFAAYENMDATEKKTAAYTEITIPKAVEIGSYAFYNGGVSTVVIPASLQKLGEAAFASSDRLATITTEEGSKVFYAKDNVLYRCTNGAEREVDREYELVCYPTARVQEGEKGARTYTVLEGTVRIQAYAFYNLNKDTVNAVVLPYSVKAIGDSAFFVSGITDYTFESIQAPRLETVYRGEVRNAINGLTTIAEYKGYYNTNFQTYLYHFTKYGGQISEYTLRYPSNGTGYDNPIYKAYFGKRIASANALPEDYTREFIKIVNDMPMADAVADWVTLETTDDNAAMVRSFIETMKVARNYYNNAKANEGQSGYITAETEEKLLSVEKALRSVKQHFGIVSKIDKLIISEDSTHRTEYKVGEKFDMTGLSVIVQYDDYSQEAANSNQLELFTTGKLTKHHKYVEVAYQGQLFFVDVTVTEEQTGGNNSASEENSSSSAVVDDGKDGNALTVVLIVGGVVALAAIGAVAVVFIKKGKRSAGEDNSSNE